MIKLVIYGTFYIENDSAAPTAGGRTVAAIRRSLAHAAQPARFRVHVRTGADGPGEDAAPGKSHDINAVDQERQFVHVSGTFPGNQMPHQEIAITNGITLWDRIKWPFAASKSFLRHFLRTGFNLPAGDPLAVIALYADGRMENMLRGRVYAETTRTGRVRQGDLLLPDHRVRALSSIRDRAANRR